MNAYQSVPLDDKICRWHHCSWAHPLLRWVTIAGVRNIWPPSCNLQSCTFLYCRHCSIMDCELLLLSPSTYITCYIISACAEWCRSDVQYVLQWFLRQKGPLQFHCIPVAVTIMVLFYSLLFKSVLQGRKCTLPFITATPLNTLWGEWLTPRTLRLKTWSYFWMYCLLSGFHCLSQAG